jgi:pimeloyl-ACP methyl ester carboxylesterase
MDNGMSQGEAEKLADTPTRPANTTTPRPQPTPPTVDLTKLNIPMLAINGEFDRPLAKTHRLWREVNNFTNVILPGKSHLTAIASGYLPPQYIDSLVKFINDNDPKP